MNQENSPVLVSLEFTPNPNTLKYIVNRQLLSSGAANFKDSESATASPLALKLFKVPGVVGVMVGRDFVTVTKGANGDWETLNRMSTDLIKGHLTEGLPVVEGEISTGHDVGSGTDLERKIQDILDSQIRPAVAMDGGDITFHKYEDGVVYLQMQGSCSGCPSATATLKMGIETRLKQAIPEIREVVSV